MLVPFADRKKTVDIGQAVFRYRDRQQGDTSAAPSPPWRRQVGRAAAGGMATPHPGACACAVPGNTQYEKPEQPASGVLHSGGWSGNRLASRKRDWQTNET